MHRVLYTAYSTRFSLYCDREVHRPVHRIQYTYTHWHFDKYLVETQSSLHITSYLLICPVVSLVFRERPLYSFAYDPCQKKLLKSCRSAQIYHCRFTEICQQKFPPGFEDLLKSSGRGHLHERPFTRDLV